MSRSIFVLVAMWMLGLSAMGAVFVLERRVRRCTGSQFDPIVAKAFIAVWQESAEDTTTSHPTNPSSIAA